MQKTSSYSSKDIRSLTDIEQLRINSEMYIGHTEHPTHLIEECFDNACDESHGNYVKVIAINVDTKNKICSVLDDGRGLPISDNVPIKICTKLHTGAKFRDNKTAYQISSGLHGIGLVAVNALSEYMTIEIYRGGRHAIFNFRNSKYRSKKINQITDKDFTPPFSTKIEFKADSKIFDNILPDIDRLRHRLTTASVQMPNVIFVLNVDDKRELFKLNLKDYFEKYVLNNANGEIIPRISINSVSGVEKFNILMSYSEKGSISPTTFSSVNLLPCTSGGTHVNLFYELLRDIFVAKAKKLGFSFQPNDCLVGLRAYLILSLKEVHFSAQIKDKLTNKKLYFSKLIPQIKTQLENYFNSHADHLVALLEYFQAYRHKLDYKKLTTNTKGKRAFTKFTKLRDCTSNVGELFICEGDSAGGGLISCRDPKQHAIFPLKGKIPCAASAKDILKHNEIGELILAIGTGVGESFDISKIRYSMIIITTDADADGDHIATLLMLAFLLELPEIVKQGYLYYAKTPLRAINEKKEFIPLWTPEDLAKAKEDDRKIIRCKGLGEFNPSQLKTFTTNEQTRNLIQVQYPEDINEIVSLFTDVEQKRKLLAED